MPYLRGRMLTLLSSWPVLFTTPTSRILLEFFYLMVIKPGLNDAESGIMPLKLSTGCQIRRFKSRT